MRSSRVWYRRLVIEGPKNNQERLLLALLRPFGFLYGLLGSVRAFAYRKGIFPTYKAGVPVISVGNLSVGGTGKTPVVDYIVKFYLTRGKRVAVVSRGYGGRIRAGVGVVSRGEGPILSAQECGDEPFLLARRNPTATVVVAPRRAEGVRLAEQELGAEVIILDDGFQHLAVARDLDIVLLDARNPLGNGNTLPAGILREFPAALGRADLFLLTRCPELYSENIVNLPAQILHSRHILSSRAISLEGHEITFESLAGKKGVAFAGLADPEPFFSDLKAAGLTIGNRIAFADHTPYNHDEIRILGPYCRDADYFITTEKDAVKLWAFPYSISCYQVPVTLCVQEEEVMQKILDGLLQ